MISSNYNYVEVVASALIVNKDKKILLIKSHKWGDAYLLPGGHVEINETIFEAAKREGKEETGLKLKPLYCVNIGELINDPEFHRKAHLIYFHVVCEALTENVQLDNKELNDFIWIEPEKAFNLKNLRAQSTIKNYLSGIKINLGSQVFGN
ncbi:MAG: NUDIX domain-containing protein [Patescibacteria group bacterium]